MTPLSRLLIAIAFTLGFSASVSAYDLPGLWTLKVENRKHQVVATLTVKFTNENALSCMSGDWSRVDIESATTRDANFFPVAGPLSFKVENNNLTIGRTEICDAYLMLGGALNEKAIKGDYFGLGLGRASSLGFFTLTRTK
jgi:hypothetical protein